MVTLTETEARVLWTVLHSAYAPGAYYAEWASAMKKLCNMGGNTYACRDCPERAPHSSHYGGFVCATHKAQEDERFKTQGA